MRHDVESYGLAFITVAYDPSIDLTINASTSDTMSIETEELSLTYLPGYDGEGVYFSLTDKKTGQMNTLGFDIRYWQSH